MSSKTVDISNRSEINKTLKKTLKSSTEKEVDNNYPLESMTDLHFNKVDINEIKTPEIRR